MRKGASPKRSSSDSERWRCEPRFSPRGTRRSPNARVQIARVHRDSGNLEGSETELRSAIVSLDGHAGMQVDAAWARHALVQTLCRMGRAVEAEPLQRAVVETMTTRRGALHSDTLTARGGLGFVLSTQGKYAEALELTEELLAKHRELLGDDHIEVAADILNLGTVHERLGHLQTAAELTNEAAVRFRRSLGATHPQTLKVEAQLARIVANFGDEEGADGAARRGLGTAPAPAGGKGTRARSFRSLSSPASTWRTATPRRPWL